MGFDQLDFFESPRNSKVSQKLWIVELPMLSRAIERMWMYLYWKKLKEKSMRLVGTRFDLLPNKYGTILNNELHENSYWRSGEHEKILTSSSDRLINAHPWRYGNCLDRGLYCLIFSTFSVCRYERYKNRRVSKWIVYVPFHLCKRLNELKRILSREEQSLWSKANCWLWKWRVFVFMEISQKQSNDYL